MNYPCSARETWVYSIILALLTGFIVGSMSEVVKIFHVHPSAAWCVIQHNKRKPYTIIIQHDGEFYEAWFSPVNFNEENPHTKVFEGLKYRIVD